MKISIYLSAGPNTGQTFIACMEEWHYGYYMVSGFRLYLIIILAPRPKLRGGLGIGGVEQTAEVLLMPQSHPTSQF